ncbi:MAG: transposase [Candidatus Omnitrophica bacterium]|nr:transposase [Candidatus Omnitrophota bacterium]
MKKKHCSICAKPMRRHGSTHKGTQRWRCVRCHHTAVRIRSDTYVRHLYTQFVRWITGTLSQTEIARKVNISRKQLSARFKICWNITPPDLPIYTTPDSVLIVDGVYLSGRTNSVLIARTPKNVRSWYFAKRECFTAWNTFFFHLPTPNVIVMDGQKGLHQAVLQQFPHVSIQRCLVHVERFIRMCVSTRPKTEAGQVLWRLTRSLWDVNTQQDAEYWIACFRIWEQIYDAFLKERSYSPTTHKRWWYTHRKLRAARSHLHNALPYLFTFLDIPNTPRTTNFVEGGINSRLKELIHRHRGLSDERKRILAAHFLHTKTHKKATQKVT